MITERDAPTHYQTILMSSDMAKLKEKTNESSTMNALSVAVKHYLKCTKTKEKQEDTKHEQ